MAFRPKFVPNASCGILCLSVVVLSVSSTQESCFFQMGSSSPYGTQAAQTHHVRFFLLRDVPSTVRATHIPCRTPLCCQKRAALRIDSALFLRVRVLPIVLPVSSGWNRT